MKRMDRRILALIVSLIMVLEMLCVSCADVNAQETKEEAYNKAELNQQIATCIEEDGKEMYIFEPETSADYIIVSQGKEDGYIQVLDEKMNIIVQDNDSGEDFNFSVVIHLEADSTYYIEIGMFQMGDEGTINWSITKKRYDKDGDVVHTDDSIENPETELEMSLDEIASGEQIDGEKYGQTTLGATSSSDFKTKILPNGTLAITDYIGNATTLNIPENIGGKKVTVIGEKAFECGSYYQYTNGEWVNTVKKNNIKTVTIPKTVVEIQYAAFDGCASLKTVNFAKGSRLKTIGKEAFGYNKSLSKFIIPTTVQEIGDNSFIECEKLTDVNLPKLKNLKMIGACTFQGTGLRKLYIPDSVTSIGWGAYSQCESATSVYIGKKITALSGGVFEGSSISSVSIPANVKEIESGAFAHTKLKAITIPNNVTTMGWYAFVGCHNLKKVTISNRMLEIPYGAFADTGVESVNIGKKTRTISDFAFHGSKNLKSISIPNSVTDIQYAAFKDCTQLSKITLPKNLERLGGRSLEGTKWYKNQSKGMIYAGKVFYGYKGNLPKNKSITIKSGTKGIAGFAMCNSAVKSVSIPEGVTNIGEAAFFNCKSLKSIYIPKSVKQIDPCAVGMVTSGAGVGQSFSPGEHMVYNYVQRLNGFTILGVKGSAAENYAKKYGIPFKQCYKVVFKVGNKVLSTQYVEKGKSAKAPSSTKKGYSITWNKKFDKVKSNLTINGKWSNVLNIVLDNCGAKVSGTTKIYTKYKKGFYANSKCKTKMSKITVPKKEGYIFGGYYTQKDGKGTKCIDKNGKICIKTNVISKDTTLYAKWTATKYDLILHANDGTQVTKNISCVYDKKTQLVPMQRPGYQLIGWFTREDGTGTSYGANAEIINLSKDGTTVHLYAQWKKYGANSMVELALQEAVGTEYRDYVYVTEVGGAYNKYNGYNGEPWCAYFVNWCARQLQIGEEIIPQTPSVSDLYNKILNNCNAQIVTAPQAGDLVFYKSRNTGKFVHIGLMVNSTQSVQGNVRSYLVRMDDVNIYRDESGQSCQIVYVRPNY